MCWDSGLDFVLYIILRARRVSRVFSVTVNKSRILEASRLGLQTSFSSRFDFKVKFGVVEASFLVA